MAGPFIQRKADEGVQLSDGYRRARKSYVLFSGLLLAFELVGFKVPDTLFFGGTKIPLERPESVPFVLLTLMTFFGFRIVLEWQLLGESIHLRNPARLDFAAAHAIAAVAGVLFLIRVVFGISLLGNLDNETLWIGLMSLILGGISAELIRGRTIFFTRAKRRLNARIFRKLERHSHDPLHGMLLLRKRSRWIGVVSVSGLLAMMVLRLAGVGSSPALPMSPLPVAGFIFGFLIVLLAVRRESSG